MFRGQIINSLQLLADAQLPTLNFSQKSTLILLGFVAGLYDKKIIQHQCMLWSRSLYRYVNRSNVVSVLLHANRHVTARMAESKVSPSERTRFGLSVLSASDCAIKSELNATARILAYGGVGLSPTTTS